MPADTAIAVGQVQAVPLTYTLPSAQDVILHGARAAYDGTGAAGSFLPLLQIVAPGGLIVSEAVLGTALAAGASADVSWFPIKGRGPCPPPTPSPGPFGTIWAWYDFADTSTITLNAGNIAKIKDKTGNGHDASQGTPANQPGETTVNGHNAGLFASASGTVLTSGPWAPNLPLPFTILVVWTQTIASSANYQPGPVGGLGPPSNAPPVLFDDSTNSNLVMELGAGAISVATAAPYTQQQASLIFAGASSNFRLNQGTHTGTTDSGLAMENIVLGASHFPSSSPPVVQYMDGALCEVLVYQGALSFAQVNPNENYLKAKWGTP